MGPLRSNNINNIKTTGDNVISQIEWKIKVFVKRNKKLQDYCRYENYFKIDRLVSWIFDKNFRPELFMVYLLKNFFL